MDTSLLDKPQKNKAPIALAFIGILAIGTLLASFIFLL